MLKTKADHRVPTGAGTLGMWLLLAALTMLFGASMLAYAIVRTKGAAAPALGTVHLPWLLWLSTALILLGSVMIHRAVAAVRRERQAQLRQSLLITCVAAIAFCIIQTPALWKLLQTHRAAASRGTFVYGLVAFLIIVHALHVLGGIVALAVTTSHAFAARYDHEHYAGVKHAAMYWHFLDAIWIVMFTVLLLLG